MQYTIKNLKKESKFKLKTELLNFGLRIKCVYCLYNLSQFDYTIAFDSKIYKQEYIITNPIVRYFKIDKHLVLDFVDYV